MAKNKRYELGIYMINSIVDKVFVITTLNSDRVDYIKSHLNDNNIKYDFFVATNTQLITNDIIVQDGGDVSNKNHKASISLISAYTSIIEISRISNFNNICIIEDDCYFSKDWIQKINVFFNHLPNNWDLLNLGYHPLHDTDTVKKKYNKYVNIPLNWHHTTHCMILKNTCYNEMLSLNNKWRYTLPIDYLFNEIYKNKKFNSYIPTDKFIHQLSIRDTEYKIDDIDIRFKSSVYDT